MLGEWKALLNFLVCDDIRKAGGAPIAFCDLHLDRLTVTPRGSQSYLADREGMRDEFSGYCDVSGLRICNRDAQDS